MSLVVDTPLLRKERGAFFTPPALAEFIVEWSLRTAEDRLLEPSCGDAVFMTAAARLLQKQAPVNENQLVGYDLHEESIRAGKASMEDLGSTARFEVGDFFDAVSDPSFDVVAGNPPYIRFQGFGGASRAASIERAQSVGVNISGLASSWAAFVVHSSTFLKPGGRMGLVLPAELLSVNYASPIREYLLRSFNKIELVLFEELVFPGVQADVVVLLADGFGLGSTEHFELYQTKNVSTIANRTGFRWKPSSPAAKWTDALIDRKAVVALELARTTGLLAPLSSWGTLSSGMVTGANDFFCMTQNEAEARGLSNRDLVRVLPSGISLSHTDGISTAIWRKLGEGSRSVMFRPTGSLDEAAKRFVAAGEALGLNTRYKCRVRTPWWRVPIGPVPQLFVSYMSGSTPRVVANTAGLRNLNSIHGLVVPPEVSGLAKQVLPLMAMSSHALLSAELEGRTYGGGVLKLEPREAGRWLVLSKQAASLVLSEQGALLVRGKKLLREGDQSGATAIADSILNALAPAFGFANGDIHEVSAARGELVQRRLTRGTSK